VPTKRLANYLNTAAAAVMRHNTTQTTTALQLLPFTTVIPAINSAQELGVCQCRI
jgi:hypothetical protein